MDKLDLSHVKTVERMLHTLPKSFEGTLYVSKHFQIDLYKLYAYDDSRSPTHLRHLEYKEKFKYYYFESYFSHYFNVEAREFISPDSYYIGLLVKTVS